jgi:hypothetical protein
MSTIQVKKTTMGYSAAMQRPRCANCALREEHWEDRSPKDVLTLRCKPGGFLTTPWAICDQYQIPSTTKSGASK